MKKTGECRRISTPFLFCKEEDEENQNFKMEYGWVAKLSTVFKVSLTINVSYLLK